MYSSQLLMVLQSFKKEEFVQFEKFLNSPYFHEKALLPELFRLWEYLRHKLEDETEDCFNRQKVYEVVFPGQQIFKSKLEKLISQLYQLVKSFLVYRQFEKQTGEKTKLVYLMEAYMERKLLPFFKQLYRKANKIPSEEAFISGVAFFQEQYLLERQLTIFQGLHDNRETDLNLLHTHFYLDLYFLVSKLKYGQLTF